VSLIFYFFNCCRALAIKDEDEEVNEKGEIIEKISRDVNVIILFI